MSEIYKAGILKGDERTLQHFGVVGMKWGVRRWQNKDGTLTDAGKKRYEQSLNGENSTKNIDKEMGRRVMKTGLKGAALAGLATVASGLGAAIAAETAIGAGAGSVLGPVGTIAGAAIGGSGAIAAALARRQREIKRLSKEAIDPNEVSSMKPGSNKRLLKEAGTLARAADNIRGFGEEMRSWINGKLSKYTKDRLDLADKRWAEYEKEYNSGDRKEQRRISSKVNSEMRKLAEDILLDIGWDVNDRNIFYLSQVIWLNEE